jgi:hypothetical protein
MSTVEEINVDDFFASKRIKSKISHTFEGLRDVAHYNGLDEDLRRVCKFLRDPDSQTAPQWDKIIVHASNLHASLKTKINLALRNFDDEDPDNIHAMELMQASIEQLLVAARMYSNASHALNSSLKWANKSRKLFDTTSVDYSEKEDSFEGSLNSRETVE